MLNIGFNIDINVKKSKFPIIFSDNTCVHCAAKDSLIFVDIFGRETKSEIHAFDHIKCKSCGTIYSITWVKDENNRMKPVATDSSFKTDFLNILDRKNIKEKGIKEI